MAIAHYYPSAGATLTLNAGVWTQTGGGTVNVTVTLDARLLDYYVNAAARRTPTKLAINLGTPPLTITLT